MLPDELEEFVLRMAELNRQWLGWGGSARLGPQCYHRRKPLASIGLSPNAKEPVRQVARNGLPKDPARKLLGLSFPDQLRGSAPKMLGSGAISLGEMCNSILDSGPERAPK